MFADELALRLRNLTEPERGSIRDLAQRFRAEDAIREELSEVLRLMDGIRRRFPSIDRDGHQ